MAMTWRFPSRLADPLWGQLPVSHDTQESETPAMMMTAPPKTPIPPAQPIRSLASERASRRSSRRATAPSSPTSGA